MKACNRREFLADVGRGMLVAGIGYNMASELGLAAEEVVSGSDVLSFGSIEPLVQLMQETPIERLLPTLVDRMDAGTELGQLVAAAALANARTFGGEDYIGFHTMMALAPAYHMALELPADRRPLPIFKVLYRNTNRIRETGGRSAEVLHEVQPGMLPKGNAGAEALRDAVRARDVNRAEQMFAALAQSSPENAFNDLLLTVEDSTEVHRVVLPYRAWDLLDLIGKEQAHTLLRQSVRYCVNTETHARNHLSEPRTLLPDLLDKYRLLDRSPGNRRGDDAWLDEMCHTIFSSNPPQAAEAVAAALSEGFDPADLGEAISLAANQLVLRDVGRLAAHEYPGKPIGSVHGDSIGVHASDSANAWRSMARVSNTRHVYACLILGGYQVALDRKQRGGDFLNWSPLPLQKHLEDVKSKEQHALLNDADEAVRGNLQARVSAVVHRYGELGYEPRPLFELLLRYAVSEDGALHAEKYYRTVREEFAATRPAFRWRHLTALARVTASEYGRPAPGHEEACSLLKL